MTKNQAIACMAHGRKVTHPVWQEGEYIFMNQETFELTDEQGQKFNWNWFWKLKTEAKWNRNWKIFR
ncbi:MAG: hypothetical protein OQK82_07105 [Candidatus Pacearchaeota archaeon]|nr:hypothetical protein [Candidatus Pacearchaeota archaeon]